VTMWGLEAEQQQEDRAVPGRAQRGAGTRRACGGAGMMGSGGRLLAWGTTAAVCLAAVAQGFVVRGPGAHGSGRLGPAARAAGVGGAASSIPRQAGVLSQLDFKPAVDLYAKFPEKHQEPQHRHEEEAELTLLNPAGVKLSVTGAAPNGERAAKPGSVGRGSFVSLFVVHSVLLLGGK
jgi:hypothetical protein